MPSITNESVLWYNVGDFGKAGYAVPNWGENIGTLNATIRDLVDTIGRNLFAFMHHDDVDLRVPPSINTIMRIHKLVLRVRSILGGRAVVSGVPNMESAHASPAPEVFLVYPCPFFRVRNSWLKSYAELVFMGLTEIMQHTENRKPFEISDSFAGLVGQYFSRIYRRMATELLGIDPKTASDPSFVLSDAQLAAYNPGAFFTATELVDTVPTFDAIFTAQQLEVLGQGILVTDLPALTPYPSALAMQSGQPSALAASGSASASGGAAATPSTVPPFPAPPSP